MPVPDPVEGLRAAFARIAATRMADLLLNNPALSVATVGFRPWGEVQVGVLIAPWAMNLAVVSADPVVLRLGSDQRQRWQFPSGDYELMGGEEPESGPFQFCSLFSPAFEFPDQAAAVAMADEVMRALFAVAAEDGREAARLAGKPVLEAPMSRRGFLRGAFR